MTSLIQRRMAGRRVRPKSSIDGTVAPVIQQAAAVLVADESAIDFTPTLTQGDAVVFTANDLPTGASINSSTGQITGTLSTVGHWPTTITATNDEGSDTIYCPIIVYSSLVTVDAAWLASEGSAPYLLDSANTVYQLDENVTEDASVFSIQADGVCIDLAGNDLIYNNDAANPITNQDFDNFTSTDPDNWTVTGDASHDKIAAASSYVYPRRLCEGDYALRITMAQGTWTAGTLTATSPANIAASSHGLVTGDSVILDGFTATTFGTSHSSLIQGGYKVTRVDDDNFTINANVSAVSDGSGNWIKATCIESDSVSLPVNNRLYSATCGVTNNPGSGADYDVSIKLVNAADGMELEKITSSEDQWFVYYHSHIGNEFFNSAPVATCKSASVANAKVQIFVSSTGAANVVDVFRVRLSQSYDNAVIARGNINSSFPQQYNYSTSGWSSSSNQGPLSIVDSVGGGSIIQGQNQGYRSWPLVLRKIGSGCIVHGFTVSVDSDDPVGVMLDQNTVGNPSSPGDGVISGISASVGNVHNVTRRSSQPSLLAIKQWLGDVIVADCTLTDCPSQTINSSTDVPATYSTLIRDTAIYPKTVCTNSYGIVIDTSNQVVERVTFDSTNATGRGGRGIMVNGGQNLTVDGVVIRNSTFRAREERHRESGASFYTRAIRVRNQENGGTTNGTVLDLLLENSTFHCECTASDYSPSVQGGRISIRDNANGMDESTYNITGCTFSAINSTGSGLAEALEIGRWDDAVAPLVGVGNTFTSNDCCLKLGGSDDFGASNVYDLDLDQSTWTKDATSGSPRTFSTFRWGTTTGSSGSITNNTFGTGTAYDDVIDSSGTNVITIEE